ncbi:SDR family NAD(P)-dependent oxidoreductase [Cohnella sp. JJ-181]|uniref:SDR family NAD(P)-dependent oxidoreductase n=1 Tax=Cohnella rhizoplanae TaxID=2974897 RepID=UPI0022FF7DE2|nr:SDR family NAD(P)-dependent oxidoreductase [Cohnella sp. JJ-181]CAI6077468.1 Putative ketoacyl reductase [Cohnella sp. JJ-181]
MSTLYKGKVAFITGGNGGIGLQTALDLGKLGLRVVIGSRDAERGQAALDKLLAAKVEAEVLTFDVNQAADHQAAYDYFEQRYGKLDVLVNNAGVQLEVEDLVPMNNSSTVTPDVLRETFDANFFGPIALTQRLLPLLLESPEGRIVNVSSVLGSLTVHANPESSIYDVKLLAYDASKTAINTFTNHLAHELRHTRVKVNSAHPGWVKTKLGGKYADMEIEESSKTSVMLATLPADGPSGKFFFQESELPW